MALHGVETFKNNNSNYVTVSNTVAGGLLRNVYFANGLVEISVSVLSASYPIVIKNFPYDFRIINCTFQNGSFGKAAHAVSLFHTSSLASRAVATFALTASRLLVQPTALNFNKRNVSTYNKLLLKASGASGLKINGVLQLKVIPI